MTISKWFDTQYMKDVKSFLPFKEVYKNFTYSKVYVNATKSERKQMNQKWFKNEYKKTNRSWKSKSYMYLGTKLTSDCIIGYKLKPESESESESESEPEPEPEPLKLTSDELFLQWFNSRYTKTDDTHAEPIKNLVDYIRTDKTNTQLTRYRKLFSSSVVKYNLKRCNITTDKSNMYGWSKNE